MTIMRLVPYQHPVLDTADVTAGFFRNWHVVDIVVTGLYLSGINGHLYSGGGSVHSHIRACRLTRSFLSSN